MSKHYAWRNLTDYLSNFTTPIKKGQEPRFTFEEMAKLIGCEKSSYLKHFNKANYWSNRIWNKNSSVWTSIGYKVIEPENVPARKYVSFERAQIDFRKPIIATIISFLSVVLLLITLLLTPFQIIGIFFSPTDVYRYYQNGLEYIEAGRIDEAMDNFRKVYKQNPYFLDVKYHYALLLLSSQNEENIKHAEKMLFENRRSLTDKENILYASILYNDGDYIKAIEILSKILNSNEVPLDAARLHFLTSVCASFEVDFQAGRNAFFSQKRLLDASLSYYYSLADLFLDNPDYYTLDDRFHDVSLTVTFDSSYLENIGTLNATAIDMITVYMFQCLEHGEEEEFLHLLNMSADYFPHALWVAYGSHPDANNIRGLLSLANDHYNHIVLYGVDAYGIDNTNNLLATFETFMNAFSTEHPFVDQSGYHYWQNYYNEWKSNYLELLDIASNT
ncbi:MAG: tetratricopeptide repeat protein [Oscillospiraceae bacterium]|jgi:tetratricopeptide (TPR) repeat protein|nr:tetratricopeptide repeat protein [Oscillospiraceae bacterium]